MKHQIVSICIPCYNKTDYVIRSLKSINVQTYKNIEVILSDDSTNKEIENIINQFPNLNIKYRHNEPPLKSPRNWNQSLDLATGDFVMLLHQDDWLANDNSIETFVNHLNQENVDFVFCKNIGVDESGSNIPFQNQDVIPNLSVDPYYLIIRCVIGPPSNMMFRKGLSIRYDENLIWFVDVDYYIRVIKAGYKFKYINQHLINIGIHPDQTTEYVRANRLIALKENLIVANKIGLQPFKRLNLFDYYWRLFRNFKIRTQEDLNKYDFLDKKINALFSKMVIVQSKFSYSLLRKGVISKTLMLMTYISWRSSHSS